MMARGSLTLGAALAAALAAGQVGAARAQGMDDGRFFVDKDDDSDEGETLFQGSLTLSNFYYRESGRAGDPPDGSTIAPESASPFARLFSDLRAQVDARHVKGGRWDARLDLRMRLANDAADVATMTEDNRLQSGLLGGNEYHLKDLYAVRGGKRADLFIGRQVVADLAATRVDGIRVDYAKSRRWTLLGFAGLHPARGSRSLASDYPRRLDEMGQATGSRVLPIAAGGGAAYRTSKSYGAFGAGLIAVKGERPRVFVTGTGYWRQGPRLDTWHYLVVDLYGNGGFALTNASAGLQWKPQPKLRLGLAAHRTDVEALRLQVRDQLENVAPGGNIVNNLVVQRVEADALRATVSSSLGRRNRFEVTAGLAARRRPGVDLTPTSSLPASQSLDVMLQAVDRGFYGGMRMDLSVMRAFGVGQASYARSVVLVTRLVGSRSWNDDRFEVQGDLAYLTSKDDNAGTQCAPTMTSTCYGSGTTASLQLSALASWRFASDWFATGSLGYGRQTITLVAGSQPPISSLTTFARLGYRF